MKDDAIKSKMMNRATYNDVYQELSLLAKNMFEWINLPDSVNERFLEMVLYEQGKLVFFKDETLGYMVARCNISGGLNIYEEPTQITTMVLGSAYVNQTISLSKCVIVRNNANETATKESIMLYAERVSETQRTIDINIKQQKTPLIILCDDTQRLTLINLYKKYDGNEPVIYGDKSLKDVLDSIKVIKTDATYLADKLMKYKHDIKNEFFTRVGINNVNTDKRERLITDEVNANNEQIEFSAMIMLNERKRACKLINKMFDLNIDVKLRDIKMYNNDENDDIIDIDGGDDNE